jgi:hypothetical protein
LPDVEWARSYPTQGPSGDRIEDVNGRACSIEFMFGSELMRSPKTWALAPVRWKSYIPAVNDYQGELTEKRAIQQAILPALGDTAPAREVVEHAKRLVDHLLSTFPRTLGPASSSISPLIPAHVRAKAHAESDDLW